MIVPTDFGVTNAVLVTTVVMSVAWYINYRTKQKKYNYAPGPKGWPVIGMLFQIGKRPQKQFVEMAKTFGNVFSLKIGTQKVTVLNGYQAVKEALVNKAQLFSGRPELWIFRRLKGGGGLGTRMYDRVWKKHRTFMLTHFRNFGVGKRHGSLEEKILEEAECLCQALEETKGEPFDCHFILRNAITNVICNILFGNRWEYDDKKFKQLLHLTADFVSKLDHNLLANFIPILFHCPWGSVPYLKKSYAKQNEFISQRIKERQGDIDVDNPKDFTEALLAESIRKQRGDVPSIFDDLDDDMDTITHLVSEFFRAGADTTNTTLRWLLMFMVSHPEAQSEVHKEIDNVLGRARPATLKDRDDLPYTQAAIFEAMRLATVVPLALPHCTIKDAKIGPYDVPKGAFVFPNLHSVHMDPTVWKNPEKYNPSRFIDSKGKLMNRDEFMPFSTGHRKCPGEQLAKMELFIFFAYIMQRFQFELVKGDEPLNYEGNLGITYTPPAFKIRCIPR
ncbi:cytochrome P450 2C44-like [Glandiceps talaboti]